MRSKATSGSGCSGALPALFLRFLRGRAGTKGRSYSQVDILGSGVTVCSSCQIHREKRALRRVQVTRGYGEDVRREGAKWQDRDAKCNEMRGERLLKVMLAMFCRISC